MIYILEDDENIRNLVIYAVGNNEGIDIKGYGLPSEFWRAMKERLPQLILLDVMLPEESGLEILKKIKKNPETKDIPVIMLTAKDKVYDKVFGLDKGADDYITKPFEIMEVVSRIKVCLRRSNNNSVEEYIIGNLYVCPSKHIVKLNGEDIALTLKEFEILELLMGNRGIVFSRDQLLQRIWGYEFDGESRTVDVHIRSLRSKMREYGSLIETVRGIGYKIGDSK